VRFSRYLSPSMVVAMLALFVALGGSALAVRNAVKPVVACGNGSVKAYASVNLDGLSGSVPGQFTSDGRYFTSRWACNNRTVELRNAGNGAYEIRISGITPRTAVASLFSGSLRGNATTQLLGDVVRIYTERTDGSTPTVGFAIAVF
jgi:hypothetical protein